MCCSRNYSSFPVTSFHIVQLVPVPRPSCTRGKTLPNRISSFSTTSTLRSNSTAHNEQPGNIVFGNIHVLGLTMKRYMRFASRSNQQTRQEGGNTDGVPVITNLGSGSST